MRTQKLAKLFGVVFLLLGVLGFIPGITSDGHLLGIFEVDTFHNVVHLLSGLAALAVAGSPKNARLYFQVFGVVYGLVTVIGFIQGTTVLGILGVNMADNILHLLIAASSLYIGFGIKEKEQMPQKPPMQPGM